jgi:hypothetical protein
MEGKELGKSVKDMIDSKDSVTNEDIKAVFPVEF